jgi:hypothetical protein
MPKSITEVLLDRYEEGDAPPPKRFTNHGDHMKAHAGQTFKPPHRAKYAEINNRIDAADKLKPRDA